MSNGEWHETQSNGASGRRPRRPLGAVTVAVVLAAVGLTGIGPARADTCSPNPVACENANTGADPSSWDVQGNGDDTVQGFATDMSVNPGATVSFKVQAQHAYTIDIYRLGYYGGLGARQITTLSGTFPAQNQSVSCVSSTATEILDCGTWAVAASWTVPATAVSGVYIAKLTRTDTGGASHITFVVRDDASTSKLLFKTSDATWQAYNSYGGADYYQGSPNGRAYKISYNRPYATRGDNAGRDFLFSDEYPMIRFLERNGYDVSYTTDVDTDRYGSLLQNHKVFLSVGHDEYWSGTERSNVAAARDAGVNLAFFSGNEAYWKTYYANSVDGDNTSHRTLVSYKDTWDNTIDDPSSGKWTGTWRDPRFAGQLDGSQPENALSGTAFMSNHDDLAMQVPPAQGRYRLWRDTNVAIQASGDQTATLPAHTIGYESDEDLDNGYRPGGLIHLSTTTGATPEYLRDFGSTVTAGTTTHHMTLYKASSGALVFSAGTIQFAWGLDDHHDSDATPLAADASMRQLVVNLLADMGVPAATLMGGLTAQSASTDTAGPAATISSPTSGTTVGSGAQVTVSGTASDAGGLVAAVEASTDGGTTWHPATGTTSWSYTFYASGVTGETVRVRAVDDSANAGPAAILTLTVNGPYTVFGARVPTTTAAADPSAVELGLRFTPQDNGYVTGVRFYKGTGNTGSHTGSLWSASGDQLATGTFTGETSTGWQTLTFPNAVAVSAGTAYVVSYYAPNGHYAADPMVFSYTGFVAPPLSVARTTNTVADGGTTTTASGVYAYGSRFPTGTPVDGTNYYVDPVFTDSAAAAPTVVSTTPAAGGQQVAVGVHPSATFSGAVNASTIQFTLTAGSTAVAGATSYDSASKTATFTPSASLSTGTTYAATVTAADDFGNAMATPYSWSFTTDAYASVSTLFAANATPATATVNDPNAVELGVKFTPAVDGLLIGVRFYKGSSNTGTHTGSLWTVTGTLLATAQFTNETGSGWQTVQFSSPVTVTAGTTYVASYYTPTGWYSADSNYFASAVTNGDLTAPAGSNGVYNYGSDAFPTNSYQSTNYWVDPLFVPNGGASPSPSPSPSASPLPSTAVTIFASSATPANASWPDPAAIEVGVAFTADVAGSVYGVKFYKGSQNTGTHTGSLWTSDGTRLATGTFTGETASGWQTLVFSSPVTITAGTTYVASYSSTVGYYAVDVNAFAGGLDNPPLHVPSSGGRYHYGSGFPDSGAAHNYWVDAVFVPAS
ncbi:MAG: hypothetical protein V7603_2119 [Micromonosporaceae bacterium]